MNAMASTRSMDLFKTGQASVSPTSLLCLSAHEGLFARLKFDSHRKEHLPSGASRCNGINHQLPELDIGNIEVLQWSYDHFSSALTDSDASLLEITSDQQTSVFRFFTLDLSALSQNNLCSVQNVLQRFKLAHLRIECSRLDLHFGSDIWKVLRAMPWSSFKSLVLAGDSIDD